MNIIKRLKKQLGVTMVEYAIMLALIAVICLSVVTALGVNANATFGTASEVLS